MQKTTPMRVATHTARPALLLTDSTGSPTFSRSAAAATAAAAALLMPAPPADSDAVSSDAGTELRRTKRPSPAAASRRRVCRLIQGCSSISLMVGRRAGSRTCRDVADVGASR